MSRMLNQFVRRLRAFAADRRGNLAITFALASVPVVVSVGAAVDYSLANRAKATLDAYADAAALSVVNTRAMSLTESQAQDSAVAFFKAQAATLSRGSVGTVTAKVTDTTSGRAAVLDYTASVETTLANVAGIARIDIGGKATANSALPVYMDFYMLLDNTPSMGVAATPADMTRMMNNTSDKCAFACHQKDAAPNDYYGLAKKIGVTMRIDVVRSATQQLMDTASSSQIVQNQFRAAVYTFGAAAENMGLTKVSSLSSNLSTVKAQANAVDLMSIPYQNYQSDTQTNFDKIFTSLNAEIPGSGDGSKSSSPQKFVFFVSDGVQDAANVSCIKPTVQGQDPVTGTKYTRCMSPLNTKFCDTLKNRGVKIAVLYTTYLALPTNGWYMSWIDPFNKGPYGPSPNSEVAKSMQACATPGYYFEVSPTDGIADAMNALFLKASQSARISK
ncbi:MAG TPA: pilus assembly protein TadG-related protein [Pseudolabrys sp.]|nr:pilus assembly protein TadG-related protein [Pseudolabrys sp.]